MEILHAALGTEPRREKPCSECKDEEEGSGSLQTLSPDLWLSIFQNVWFDGLFRGDEVNLGYRRKAKTVEHTGTS